MKKNLSIRGDDVRTYAYDLATRQIEILYLNFERLGPEEDIEYLHDMRVASRRLREVLSFFAFLQDETKLRKTISRVRRITRTVGQSREMDVNLELLGNFSLPPDPELEASCEHFQELFALEQKKLRERMNKGLRKIRLGGRKNSFLRAAKAFLLGPACMIQRDGKPAVASLEAFSQRMVSAVQARLKGLNEFEGIEANPENDGRLHRLRIQVKKFRYTLEICDPMHEDRFDRAIALAKELQDVLGQIHDYGVLIDRLSALAKLLEKRRRWHLLQGSRSLILLLSKAKCSLYQQFGPAYKAFLEEVSGCVPAERPLENPAPEQATPQLEAANPFMDF